MHIRIDMYPDSFPIDPENWKSEMINLNLRIEQVILDGTINDKSYAKGKTTLLHLDNSQMIVATIDIRRE